ncbi:hypothetical protein AcV5_002083 [Taiwanofungus camphoratus]|nr:hypothetical protein AcV5_002083 [Antrodia cinnamomea]KAI0943898.1 hypothetical protein AcV7_001859 [Antrodia cinnamomea]
MPTGKPHTLVQSTLTRPVSESVATSQEIRDRGSTFVGNIFPAPTPHEARAAIAHIKNVLHGARPASHEIAAWRCMVVKPDRTGLGGPDDFELKTGSEDDGEQWGGGKVLKVMQEEGVIDAVVIVSRWYGGVMLGPVRFSHIETCAREVCRTFRLKDDIETSIATLLSLDDILSSLRTDLSKITSGEASKSVPGESSEVSPKKVPDYTALKESLDINKAKRLITARENAIKSVKIALKKAENLMEAD